MLLAATAWSPVAVAQQASGTRRSQQARRADPSDGSVSRADYIATMDGEFRKRDANHDGILTQSELENYERNVARVVALRQNRQIFAKLDVDHNGALSPSEFAALVGQPPTPDVSREMQRLDQNHDGKITIIEHRAAKLVNFDKLDTDFDGIVTQAEMKAGQVQRQQEPASR